MQVERAGDAQDRDHPGAALGALDEADIIAVEPGQLRQFFLAEAFEVAVTADVPAEAASVFGGSPDQARRYVELLATDGVTRGLIGPREAERICGNAEVTMKEPRGS